MYLLTRITGLLMLALTASFAVAADLENLTDGERDALHSEIRTYLLENPQIIVEVIEILEKQREQAEARAALTLVADNSEDIFNDGYSYVGNNPEGDLTIVEFLDYRCGFCKRAHENVHALLESDPGIRYIVKEYPILGPESVLASRAAISMLMTQGDDAYFAFNDALMRFNGPINDTSLGKLARGLGLDEAAMLAGMDNSEVSERISRTHELGGKLLINGTPSFIVGNEIIRGFMTFDQMIEVVGEVRLAQK